MTNAELALLSLLAEQPRYGYEIEQLIEQRGMRAWTELGFSSIYYLLKKLARQGRLKGRRIPGTGGPSKVIYSLTTRGASTFRRAVASALATPARTPPWLRNSWMRFPKASSLVVIIPPSRVVIIFVG